MVRKQLAEKGKTLAAGSPPLTVMSARAYAEIVAYAEQLQCEPQATPDQIDGGVVATIQKQMVQAWPKLDKAQREQVRTMLDKLARAAVAPAETQSAKPPASAGKPMGMTTHWALMQMQKQTFNTWQWSRGYKSTMFGF